MSTLENLYTYFEKYNPSDLICCSCCHSPEFVKRLQETSLRTIPEMQMYEYFCSALYTCEGTSAFKYFLPRLFELFPEELWQFHAKFKYVDWEDWENEEIAVIKAHVFTIWANEIAEDRYCTFDDYFKFFSFKEIFSFWENDHNFLRDCLPYAAYFEFETNKEKQSAYLLLESLFFDEADKDTKFANELSAAAEYVLCLPPWD